MTTKFTENNVAERREKVLRAARWCFLNFGFTKTTFEDIAKRANISRTLLYRTFKDKEDIFTAVFAFWLLSRHPGAQEVTKGPGSPFEKLISVCKLMVLEPWSDLVTSPMGSEFFDVCERINPEVEALHRKVALECVTAILGAEEQAEVFTLALEGLLTDQPTVAILEKRLRILAERFVPPSKAQGKKSV